MPALISFCESKQTNQIKTKQNKTKENKRKQKKTKENKRKQKKTKEKKRKEKKRKVDDKQESEVDTRVGGVELESFGNVCRSPIDVVLRSVRFETIE